MADSEASRRSDGRNARGDSNLRELKKMDNDLIKVVEDGLQSVKDSFEKEIDARLDAFAREYDLTGESQFAGNGRGGKTHTLPTFGNDEAVKRFASDRSLKSVNVAIDLPTSVWTKAIVGDVASGGDTSYDIAPQRSPTLANVSTRRLSVFDVLPRLSVTSNSFEYNALDSYTSAAEYQTSEGVIKAEGTMPTVLKSAPICTIAHYFKLSEQVLADAPALQKQVTNLLAYGVLAKVSREILIGSTLGKIQGLATQATGTYSLTTTATLADQIGDAMTALDVAGWQPDVVFMHPTDWYTIRSERVSGTDEYVANGWAGPAEQGIWGLRVVTDPSVPVGGPIVLDSRQVAILDRMQTRVEFGRSGNDMTYNLITALAECRVGLVVFAPSAIVQLDN